MNNFQVLFWIPKLVKLQPWKLKADDETFNNRNENTQFWHLFPNDTHRLPFGKINYVCFGIEKKHITQPSIKNKAAFRSKAVKYFLINLCPNSDQTLTSKEYYTWTICSYRWVLTNLIVILSSKWIISLSLSLTLCLHENRINKNLY